MVKCSICTVEEYIEQHGVPEGIVTETDALWDKKDGKITDHWLLKRNIIRVNNHALVVE